MYAERVEKCQSKIEEEFLMACCTVGLLVEPQYPIGPIHVDFAIPDRKIAIECDGKEYHGDYLGTPEDTKRDQICKKANWLLIRINGNAIRQNADKIVWDIKRGAYEKEEYWHNYPVRIYMGSLDKDWREKPPEDFTYEN